MKKYKRGELAKQILKGLVLGGFIVACFALPGLAQVATLFKPKSAQEHYRIKQAVRGLVKNKWVKIYQKGDRDVVEITEAGKKKILEYNFDEMRLKVPKKWDGWWRIIMFDIPETKKQARRAVSFKIKELGLYRIQKSVFVSPYPCKNEIDFIGEFFNVRKEIIYMRAKEIEGVKKLKSHFNVR
ncbi:MAG: CRISPR-associated endonuclease Cas2 [Candidatus Yonathbacteria bacterium]|nr:CRISPR-associated endonuclease Cas2 [Candidatus Yonathbacteria bacterium]